ncbi:hypothetical protein FOA43_000278 [Brettanomyces nanus]|uniref:mRNA decay factor PAT1 domain-containing protein n=1 Tax=Eeniella nana TaxID=13502 RepID=A0A875S0J2_EENNA|nr:uncharacterized protein FOA43_000278 [Brettanomyces nanus]QPG72974.1 hypothetical protein FOA43_000278 [Brettanomyces nanus]
MSFFGFDPKGSPDHQNDSQNNKHDGKVDIDRFQNFEDQLNSDDEDALNDETFGTESGKIGADFDFSSGFGSKPASSSKGGLKAASTPARSSNISYAQAAHTTGRGTENSSLKPMESLWNDQNQGIAGASAPINSQEIGNTAEPEKKVFSLEEIEAKLRAQPPISQPQMAPQQQLPPGMNPFMLPPQAQQQILASAVASGRFPDMQTAARAMSQMLMAPPPPMQQGMMPPQFMGFPQMPMQPMPMHVPPIPQGPQLQQVQQAPQQPIRTAPPMQATSQPSQPIDEAPIHRVDQSARAQTAEDKTDSNSFSSIDAVQSDENQSQSTQNSSSFSSRSSPPSSQQQQYQRRPQHQQQFHQSGFQGYRGGNNYKGHHFYNQQQRQYQHQQQMENMSPEERAKFISRQEKVNRITRASGFMNPRDKDFVTRFQLSQIVTDDPYNEDFYCQVYKVLNSSVEENSMNSLAKKYLEQSGHRLGGRSKRADIALQRMQQQVSRAVSVAKERGQRTGILSKEGALGKVSFATGRQPRQMLVVNSEETEKTQEIDDDNLLPKEYKFSKSSRSFQLSIIEKVYSEVLKSESRERENEKSSDADLWKSLHLNDKMQTSTNEMIDPFISVLSFDKMMKVFGRVFHLLTAEHQIGVVELIFSNLQKIDVILKGSYKNYVQENYQIPEEVNNKIGLFQVTILKSLVLYLSESKFALVIHFLQCVVENNNVLFLSTAKIGLSLVTVLISRLELIKQEYAKDLSAQDLSQWQQIYDSLFQCLEGRLVSVFPPYFSNDEQKMVRNDESKGDDSYIWQFLASLSLAGQLSHQRVIVDEVRNEIFGAMGAAKKLKEEEKQERAEKYLNNLNLFLNVMGLKASENDITELSDN